MKKLFFPAVIVMGIVLVVVSGCSNSNNKDFKKSNEKISKNISQKDYEKLFYRTYQQIVFNTQALSSIANLTSHSWSQSIEMNIDINKGIEIAMKIYHENGLVSLIDNINASIEKNMKALKDYPSNYKEAYDMLLDSYAVYSQFYMLSLSPSGSLMNYGNRLGELELQCAKSFSKVRLFLPELKEDYSNKEILISTPQGSVYKGMVMYDLDSTGYAIDKIRGHQKDENGEWITFNNFDFILAETKSIEEFKEKLRDKSLITFHVVDDRVVDYYYGEINETKEDTN